MPSFLYNISDKKYLPQACWFTGICVNILWKRGEQTDNTKRCAFTNCPSAANITSTRSPRHNDSWNPADRLLLKLFQQSENCSSSAMLAYYVPLPTSNVTKFWKRSLEKPIIISIIPDFVWTTHNAKHNVYFCTNEKKHNVKRLCYYCFTLLCYRYLFHAGWNIFSDRRAIKNLLGKLSITIKSKRKQEIN